MDVERYIIAILLLLFGIAAVGWGRYGPRYRAAISRKHNIRYLDVEMSVFYQIAFWLIVVPLFILQTLNWILS